MKLTITISDDLPDFAREIIDIFLERLGALYGVEIEGEEDE